MLLPPLLTRSLLRIGLLSPLKKQLKASFSPHGLKSLPIQKASPVPSQNGGSNIPGHFPLDAPLGVAGVMTSSSSLSVAPLHEAGIILAILRLWFFSLNLC